MKKSILISAICLCATVMDAQVADSSGHKNKQSALESFQEKDLCGGDLIYTPRDTFSDNIQKYFPNNFSYSLGLIKRRIIFSPETDRYLSDDHIGFRSGISSLDIFGYNEDSIKYYRTRAPYTDIFVLFGMKKEQYSRILHTQNINKQWNIAINMLRIRSEGFYQHQNCTDNNMSVSTNYLSKNKRYSLLANGIVRSLKSDENGGITSDSAFEQNLFGNKKLLQVNLTDSRSKRLHREIYIKPTIYFGKKTDTIKTDSVTTTRITPTSSISFFFLAGDNTFAYNETHINPLFYQHTFYDTARTHDSTRTEEYRKGINFQSVLLKKLNINIGLEQKNMRLVQYYMDSTRALNVHFSDNILHLQIGSVPRAGKSSGLFWNAGKEYIYHGNHKNENYLFGNIRWLFKKQQQLYFSYTNTYRSVPFIYNEYTSNHFIWRNDYGNISEKNIKLNYANPKNKFSVGFEMNRITGYVYFDTAFFPKQFNNEIIVNSIFIRKIFRLGHFFLDNKITWQKSTSDLIHLPEWVTNHSIYYEGNWFRKATRVQLGFDVSYCSSYYADAYMPAPGQYYLQNKKLLGNYPYLDFFFSMKIKRANVFVKSENINSGFTGPNYYLAPHMPGSDRNFKVGIKWVFFN